jgi:hypothetical protein
MFGYDSVSDAPALHGTVQGCVVRGSVWRSGFGDFFFSKFGLKGGFWGLGFRVSGFGFRGWGLRCGGLGVRVWGSGFRV